MWKVEKKTLKGLTSSYTLPQFYISKAREKGVKAFCIKATEIFTFFTMSEDKKEHILMTSSSYNTSRNGQNDIFVKYLVGGVLSAARNQTNFFNGCFLASLFSPKVDTLKSQDCKGICSFFLTFELYLTQCMINKLVTAIFFFPNFYFQSMFFAFYTLFYIQIQKTAITFL